MEAASVPWRPLGELFVSRGLITESELEAALAEQVATGLRLGEILVKRNLISSPELTQALMEQLGREVAKEEGFGSGLWAEIQRRNARPQEEPHLTLVGDERPPFGGALTQALEVTSGSEDSADPDEVLHQAADSSSNEWEELRRELDARDAAIELLSAELDRARADAIAREQSVAAELAAAAAARGEAHELQERLEDRERQLTELGGEIIQLRASRAYEQAGSEQAGSDQAEIEQALERARGEVTVAAARISELDQTLLLREHRIEELERELREPGCSAAMSELEELLRAREGRIGELEMQLDIAAASAQSGIAELASERDSARCARDTALEAINALEGRIAVLAGELELSDATLSQEREAHRSTQQAGHEREQTLLDQLTKAGEREAKLAGEIEHLVELYATPTDEEAAESTGAMASQPGQEEEYLCLAPSPDGYRLLTRTGLFPTVGSFHELDGRLHTVTTTGRSPLPLDSRRCAYLQAE